MKNADLPAMPFVEPDAVCSVSIGLTKREMFAMHFHAALLTAQNQNGDWVGACAGAAEIAVREADALLAELEKQLTTSKINGDSHESRRTKKARI